MRTFSRLLGFLRPYRGAVIGSLVLASLAMVATVALPWLTGKAIDRIDGGDRSGLWIVAGAVLGGLIHRPESDQTVRRAGPERERCRACGVELLSNRKKTHGL